MDDFLSDRSSQRLPSSHVSSEVDSLGRLAAHLRDYHPIEPVQVSLDLEADPAVYAADFCDIKGQEHVK